MKSVFLAWQDPPSRAWFPVGRLDAEPRNSGAFHYWFRYTQGALRAKKDLGFAPLLAFPKLETIYESDELFPLFKNRVLSAKRKDFQEYIEWLDLDRGHADPMEILSVSGGERITDSLEVFPKIGADAKGRFQVRFFLHGLRHLGEKAMNRVLELKAGEELRVAVELNNPATRLAVPLLTEDYTVIGWAPRYLVEDLVECIPQKPEIEATVARINSDDAPPNQRVLVNFSGKVRDGHQPMSSPDFLPLAEE